MLSIKNTTFAMIILGLIVVSTFGPYLMASPGIRTEQLVIYLLLFVVFFTIVVKKNNTSLIKKHLLSILVLYVILISWIFFNTLIQLEDFFTFSSIAAFENLLQPVVVLMIIWLSTQDLTPREIHDLLIKVIKLILLMMVINTLLALVTYFYDTWWLVKYFTGDLTQNAEQSRIWKRSTGQGRIIGIYNQPFEAGVAYSFALLCWVYIYKLMHGTKLLYLLTLVILIIGGWLTGSKVFLLGGAPLGFAYYMYVEHKVYKRRIFISVIAPGIFILMFTFSLTLMGQVGPMASLFKNNYVQNNSLLQVVSGGRFGKIEETKTEKRFKDIWSNSPAIGKGFPANHALDNGYLHLFIYGGSVAILMFFSIIIAVVFIAMKISRYDLFKALLLYSIVVLIVGGSLGATVLTINRVSVLIWVVMGLVVSSTRATILPGALRKLKVSHS